MDPTIESYYGVLGPQSDGTYGYAVQTPLPVDTGGGLPGSYGSGILDVFKYGVGIWTAREQSKDLLEYKRFEATQQGLALQGQAALQYQATRSQGNTTMLMIGAIALVGLLVLARKG